MTELERYNKITELLEKFDNGEELYKTNPMFNVAIHMLVDDVSIYSVLESIVIASNRGQEAFTDHLRRYGNPSFTRQMYENDIN